MVKQCPFLAGFLKNILSAAVNLHLVYSFSVQFLYCILWCVIYKIIHFYA